MAKNGGDGVMVWVFFAAYEPLFTSRNWCNHEFYQIILKEMSSHSLCPKGQAWSGYATGQLNTAKHHYEWFNKKTQHVGLLVWLWTIHSCSKTLQCCWIKSIWQMRMGQNFSTLMWKTHYQLLWTLGCISSCQGWHGQVFGNIYSPFINDAKN